MQPCAVDGCKWSMSVGTKHTNIRAHNRGWYLQKNGKIWCPEHRPHFAPILSEDHEARRTYICTDCAGRKIVKEKAPLPSYFRCPKDWCVGCLLRQKIRR